MRSNESTFLFMDKTGRGIKSRLTYSKIKTNWDLTEEDKNGNELLEFIENCEQGDVFENQETRLECMRGGERK